MNEDLEFENSVVLALVQAFIGAIAPEVRAISITVDRVKRSTDIYVALSNAFQDMDDLFDEVLLDFDALTDGTLEARIHLWMGEKWSEAWPGRDYRGIFGSMVD